MSWGGMETVVPSKTRSSLRLQTTQNLRKIRPKSHERYPEAGDVRDDDPSHLRRRPRHPHLDQSGRWVGEATRAVAIGLPGPAPARLPDPPGRLALGAGRV